MYWLVKICHLAKAVFANAELRNYLLTKFLDLVDKECNELCRKTDDAPFRHIPVDKLATRVYLG